MQPKKRTFVPIAREGMVDRGTRRAAMDVAGITCEVVSENGMVRGVQSV